jgi:probable FeS assembly SUF system protein SufT
MSTRESIALHRECRATVIPSGEKVTLSAGALVVVTQSLGGSYTLMTDQGFMVRLAGEDADAIGEKVASPTQPVTASDAPLEKLVWDQLKTCYDPEIPVNIADLGLIYLCKIAPVPEGGTRVEIQMTLTAPGCGMGEALRTDVERKVSSLPGVKEVKVELVWDPPWSSSMLSQAAKLQLGMM